MNITNHTPLNLVIGYPLKHTQSPILHQEVYQQLHIHARMLAKSHPNLGTLIQTIKTLDVRLTAVTAPFKEQVLHYLDDYSPEVQALKAANTIIQRNGLLYGYNTDVDGIIFALREINWIGKRVLIIGAGGAARAMGYVLHHQPVELFWMNRTREKVSLLAKTFGGKIIDTPCNESIDVFINTTPIGLYPNHLQSPLPDYPFQSHHVVFDMIYNPLHTALLKHAKKLGATTLSGLDMFVMQGIKQIELSTGLCFNNINHLKQTLIREQSKHDAHSS